MSPVAVVALVAATPFLALLSSATSSPTCINTSSGCYTQCYLPICKDGLRGSKCIDHTCPEGGWKPTECGKTCTDGWEGIESHDWVRFIKGEGCMPSPNGKCLSTVGTNTSSHDRYRENSACEALFKSELHAVSVMYFATEDEYDYLLLSEDPSQRETKYMGKSAESGLRFLTKGGHLTWTADGVVQAKGWMLCSGKCPEGSTQDPKSEKCQCKGNLKCIQKTAWASQTCDSFDPSQTEINCLDDSEARLFSESLFVRNVVKGIVMMVLGFFLVAPLPLLGYIIRQRDWSCASRCQPSLQLRQKVGWVVEGLVLSCLVWWTVQWKDDPGATVVPILFIILRVACTVLVWRWHRAAVKQAGSGNEPTCLGMTCCCCCILGCFPLGICWPTRPPQSQRPNGNKDNSKEKEFLYFEQDLGNTSSKDNDWWPLQVMLCLSYFVDLNQGAPSNQTENTQAQPLQSKLVGWLKGILVVVYVMTVHLEIARASYIYLWEWDPLHAVSHYSFYPVMRYFAFDDCLGRFPVATSIHWSATALGALLQWRLSCDQFRAWVQLFQGSLQKDETVSLQNDSQGVEDDQQVKEIVGFHVKLKPQVAAPKAVDVAVCVGGIVVTALLSVVMLSATDYWHRHRVGDAFEDTFANRHVCFTYMFAIFPLLSHRVFTALLHTADCNQLRGKAERAFKKLREEDSCTRSHVDEVMEILEWKVKDLESHWYLATTLCFWLDLVAIAAGGLAMIRSYFSDQDYQHLLPLILADEAMLMIFLIQNIRPSVVWNTFLMDQHNEPRASNPKLTLWIKSGQLNLKVSGRTLSKEFFIGSCISAAAAIAGMFWRTCGTYIKIILVEE